MLKKSIFVSLCLLGAQLLSAAPAGGRLEPHPEGPRYCKTDPSKSQVLFENGKVNFEIVYTRSHRPSILAASELADLLGKALGVKLRPCREPSGKVPSLIVGDAAAARAAGFDPQKMERGAFRIKTVGRNIVLAGRDEEQFSDGTFYAVYDFLERFVGIRSYFPGEVGTIIPKLKK